MNNHDDRSRSHPTSPYVVTRPSRINGLLIILVFLLALWMIYTQVWPRFLYGSAAPRPIDPRGDLMEIEKTTIQIFQHVSPSVVFVTNASYRRNWSGQILSVPQGSGSGFIWDEAGHIVTNYHVIENADRLIVTLENGESYEAVPIGASQQNDLAVLRITVGTEYLKPIPIGSSHDLRVGQEVFAIGNPFGFDQTLTRGVISAVNRDLPQNNGAVLHDLIQTDAAINPGNSGGPLLDSAGRLIGMNTAIISPSRASAGIGFAIPVDLVNQLVPQLINHGQPVRPVFGFTLARSPVKVDINGTETVGLRITKVYQGRPAEKAGLEGDRFDRGYRIPGDVLLAIDDQRVTTLEEFNAVMEKHEIGDTVKVRVYHFSLEGNEVREFNVTLEAGPDPG